MKNKYWWDLSMSTAVFAQLGIIAYGYLIFINPQGRT